MHRQALLKSLKRCSRQICDGLQVATEHLEKTPTRVFSREVKVQANDLRVGNVLECDGRLCHVVKAVHTVGQGRQIGNVQIELKEISSKRKLHLRHRPYDMLEKVRLEDRKFQLLYAEGEDLHLMDPDTYSQATVSRSLFGDSAKWLVDGMDVTLLCLEDGRPLLGEIPASMTFTVKEAAAYAKGDTAGASSKPCTLENGLQILVPAYVQTGQKIVVNIPGGSFVKRA